MKKFVEDQISDWTKDIEALAEIAKSDPQIAYSAYVFGTSKRWQFVCRTTPGISDSMQNMKIRSVAYVYLPLWANTMSLMK